MKFGKWFERGNKGKEGGEDKARIGRESGEDLTRFISDEEMERDLPPDVLIRRAGSLEELKLILRRNDVELKGSKQSFSANELCYIIDKIVAKEFPLTHATSTAGFIDKVEELAKKEGRDIIRE